jgi:hypothetical protein
MKVLFTNSTSFIAYIAVVDHDKEYRYIGEPIVCSLNPNQSCYYETTALYFYGSLVENKCVYDSIPVYSNMREIIPLSSEAFNFRTRPYYISSIDTYLVQHPEIKSAEISNDALAQRLKNGMYRFLEEYYKLYDDSLELKEPEKD